VVDPAGLHRACALIILAATPAFAIDNVVLAGSASLDYRYVSGDNPPTNPSLLGITSLGLEVAAKAVIDVGHGVSFTVKACGGCHGIEIDQAYGEVMLKEYFNVRLGRINPAFGEFNQRHDPANFTTPSKPLPYAMGDMLFYSPRGFNLGIVPSPYVENGMEIYGTLALSGSTQLDYAIWGAKGLAGENGIDWVSTRRYLDNNRLPAGGGRVVLSGADWAVGASFSAGTYDDRDRLVYMMGGAELYFRVGIVTFRAELLARRTDLDRDAGGYPFALIDPWFLKVGWYGQLDLDVHPSLTLVLRSDGLHRFGMPLPASEIVSASAGMQRQTVALLYRLTGNFALKGDYELWTFTGTPLQTRHMARLAMVFGY
jgi:hypothetical protein